MGVVEGAGACEEEGGSGGVKGCVGDWEIGNVDCLEVRVCVAVYL